MEKVAPRAVGGELRVHDVLRPGERGQRRVLRDRIADHEIHFSGLPRWR